MISTQIELALRDIAGPVKPATPAGTLLESPESDVVNVPYYRITIDGNTFEVNDLINAMNLSYPIGTALAYMLRAGRKDKSNAEQDLKKCIYYVAMELVNRTKTLNNAPDMDWAKRRADQMF